MTVTGPIADGELSPRESGVRLTADRDELKFLLPAAQAESFVEHLSPQLAPHRYATAAPGTLAYSTTLYFDTPERDLYRAAIVEPLHVKVRVREYYETVLGNRDDGRPLPGPQVVWLELKVRDGRRTRKRRACIGKRDFQRWFGAAARGELDELGEAACTGELAQIGTELQRLRDELHAPLVPSCVVNYRRLSWEDEAASLRVTLDSDVCAFAAPAEPWSERVLTPQVLGAPAYAERRCVLEVKSRGPLPAWVAELLRGHDAVEVYYSKFVMASRAVHGAL